MSTMPDLTGRHIGHYKITRYITSGGMAAVYQAIDTRTNQPLAIKVLPTRLAEDANYKARFDREAQTAESLKHPHIVSVFGHGNDGDLSYVVMRLLEGGTLTQRMRARQNTAQPLPSLTEIATLLRQVTSALDFAHGQRVIHRDIKPSNIMFDNKGNAYIVDFGIAKLLTSAAESLTETGVPMGTPLYMAPEQWDGANVTAAVDQYALGVVVYRLLTGSPPFQGDTIIALMSKHKEAPVPPLENYPRQLSENLHAVVSTALAKDPRARYATMSAFAEAFTTAIGEQRSPRTDYFTFNLTQTADRLPPGPVEVNTQAPTKLLDNRPAHRQPSDTHQPPLGPNAATIHTRPGRLRGLWLLVGVLMLLVGAAAVLTLTTDGAARDNDDSAAADAMLGTGLRLNLRYDGPTLVVHNPTDETLNIENMRFETSDSSTYFDASRHFGPDTSRRFLPGRCMAVSLTENAPALPDYCAAGSREPLLWNYGTASGTYFVWDREITGVQRFLVTLDGVEVAQCPLDAGECVVAFPESRISTPTATPAPVLAPQPAEQGGLLLIYSDAAALTIINTSMRSLSLSGMQFETRDGQRYFDSEWFGDQTVRDFLPNSCIFISLLQEQRQPPDFCETARTLGYNQVDADRYVFVWTAAANPDDVFRVTQRGRDLADCVLSAGRCFVEL